MSLNIASLNVVSLIATFERASVGQSVGRARGPADRALACSTGAAYMYSSLSPMRTVLCFWRYAPIAPTRGLSTHG